MEDKYRELTDAVITGDTAASPRLVRQLLDAGQAAKSVLDRGLLPGMDVVGQRFKAGDMFIPEVLLSARTMQAGMQVLRPLLTDKEATEAGSVVIGTVEGDVHNIGKNLVAMMMEGAGFKVTDLGVDVRPDAFVQAVREHKPSIVAMSALLTTTMPKMMDIVDALREAGVRDQLKIMVGGAPVTQEFAIRIGADGYGSNAAAAVDVAKALMSK